MKIVNRKKFVSSILLMLGVIVFICFCISNTSLSHGEIEYKTIYVANGDSLWSIAKMEVNSNEYYFDKDVRDVVENLKRINHLSDTSLKIGQELQIPTINIHP